jgi:hypothetical protein
MVCMCEVTLTSSSKYETSNNEKSSPTGLEDIVQ